MEQASTSNETSSIPSPGIFPQDDNAQGEFQLTRDEYENFKEALKKEEFRKLLSEYAEDVTDPKNQEVYQREMRELERQRGNIVHFINPIPGYVLKTVSEGVQKIFINICGNPIIKRPTFNPVTGGNRMSIPHATGPVREDYDKTGKGCKVYDVIFHPEALIMGKGNEVIRKKVEETALEAIERSFNVTLDKANVRKPRLNYKGIKNATIVKYKMGEVPSETIDPTVKEIQPQSQEEYLYRPSPAPPLKNDANKPNNNGEHSPPADDKLENKIEEWTTPKYTLKYRSQVDLQDCCIDNQRECRGTKPIPEEIVLTIDLPMLKNSSSLDADVTEDGWHFELKSERKAAYRLSLKLPFQVEARSEMGKASFDVDARKLTVILKTIQKSSHLISNGSEVRELPLKNDADEEECKRKELKKKNKKNEKKSQSQKGEGDALRMKNSVDYDENPATPIGSYDPRFDVPAFINSEIVVKSILKKGQDSSRSRSKSESWIHHMNSKDSSSFEGNEMSDLDEGIESPPDGGSGSEKSVRFNDSVHHQLFRSNSSIEGQRKKNQRKAKNKRRARERKASESSISSGSGCEEEEILGNEPYKKPTFYDQVFDDEE